MFVLPAREGAQKNKRAIMSCRPYELPNEPNKWFLFSGWIERGVQELGSQP
jgi:hypothetical protein